MTYIEKLGANAKAASRSIAAASSNKKNAALAAIADSIIKNT